MPPLRIGLRQRLGGYRRSEVSRIVTNDPWTKDFKHLQPIPRHWLAKGGNWGTKPVRTVPPKDRIKYWNIVPGDQIRVRGDRNGIIHEVLSINKLRNRVHLKGTAKSKKVNDAEQMSGSRSVMYGNCQLFIGNYDFPPKNDAEKQYTTPVFALRLGSTKPTWLPSEGRWHWERFAIRTVPKLPDHEKRDRIVIPWPSSPKETIPEPSNYDTTSEAVIQVTYQPPILPRSFKYPRPRPTEDDYIKWLFNPNGVNFDAWSPMEIHLYKELSNPHSRAKKQSRWQEHQIYKRKLLREYLARQLASAASTGRAVQEARAEAAWKWRRTLEEEESARKNRRWKSKDVQARMLRKKERKVRKIVKQRQSLTEMVLQGGRNQVIPGSEPTNL